MASSKLPAGRQAQNDNAPVDTAKSSTAAHETGNAIEVDEDADCGGTYSSPPCFMHELDPAYLGYYSTAELIPLLNELIEAERAGAKAVRQMAAEATGAATTVLARVAGDEARFCAMLSRHVERLGGIASTKTGDFRKKIQAVDNEQDRLRLLNRGQGWVARRLREAMPRIYDDPLRMDLTEMLEVHDKNIGACDTLLPDGRTKG